MANIKSFIHGNAIDPQHLWDGDDRLLDIGGINNNTHIVGLPQSVGKIFRGKGGWNVYFHAPIPTLVVASSALVQLEDVFVFFDADADCFMSNLDVTDGGGYISQITGLHTSGNNRVPMTGINAFQIRTPLGSTHTMEFGLNIAMLINFVADSTITFRAAGASFITSD